MIVIGHPAIPGAEFRKISCVDDVGFVPANAIAWFESEPGCVLSRHCFENGVKYAVRTDNVVDFILHAALKPAYFLIGEDAPTYQKLAENYLLDSKILAIIDEVAQIGEFAMKGIDGVIFRNVLE